MSGAVVEPSVAMNKQARRPRQKQQRTSAAGELSPRVAGVRISNPDRLIYPDLGISKIQLAQYYERIAAWIVPHVAGRPLTLLTPATSGWMRLISATPLLSVSISQRKRVPTLP